MPKPSKQLTRTCGGEVIVGIFFGGDEEDEEVCLATPERKGKTHYIYKSNKL